VEAEHLPAGRVLLQVVGELGDRPGGLVGEGQGQFVSGEVGGESVEVLSRLGLDAGQRVPLGLGLDDPDGLAVRVQEVVGEPGLERELPAGHPGPGEDVQVGVVLDRPPGLGEQGIYLLTGFEFGRHGWGPGTDAQTSVRPSPRADKL
jgi:hypothetical protein